MEVFVGGRRVRPDPARSLGKGGEADVYDIGGLALKLFKGPDHPDYRGRPDEQLAARERLRVRPQKLRDFPRGLPERIVAPLELATDRRGAVVGYTMPLVGGAEALQRWADPGRTAPPSLFLDLHDTVTGLHAKRVVIGDFNDLNVLVSAGGAHVIDADSFQFGPYRCEVFTERFLDPLLSSPSALALARPYSPLSDWYAFAVLLLQSLVHVGPYGGVYRPRNGRPVPHVARPLHRITVFHPEVLYPKPAVPLDRLPAGLRDYFEQVFVKDRREVFPRRLIEALHVSRSAPAARPSPPERGRVTATRLPRRPARPAAPRFWEEGGRLLREGALGAEHVGDVLAGQTRFWVGPEFGLGFYRAGTVSVGFVFDVRHRGINDGVRLPLGSGRLVDAGAVFGSGRAWLFLHVEEGGRAVHRCVLARPDGRVETVGEGPRGDGTWLGTWGGWAASGPHLFVPTDAGIVRVGEDGGIREFPDTEPYVDSACRLAVLPEGILVEREPDSILLRIG